ncbi:hypothetical protein SAMN04487951_102376 [Vreelandella arcis]|uniref:Uncharacterized protein n=1 Tax=Vreelandella arcis TaxID=416873 RepID=A0A1G9YZ61_9GAMM|nr:hypothetical protein SAMN04487951_102376 [Halomonas arcis]
MESPGTPAGSLSGTYTAENPANRLGFLFAWKKNISKKSRLSDGLKIYD